MYNLPTRAAIIITIHHSTVPLTRPFTQTHYGMICEQSWFSSLPLNSTTTTSIHNNQTVKCVYEGGGFGDSD